MKREKPSKNQDKLTTAGGKKIYVVPRLTIYGDFRRLTLGKGNTAKDNPVSGLKTKSTGAA